MAFSFDDPPLTRGPFHEQIPSMKLFRPVIQKSLQRCWPRLHLDQQTSISPEKLSQIIQENAYLLSVAQPLIDEINQHVDNNRTALAIVEHSGYLIYLHGGSYIIDYLRDKGIDLGTDLSEVGSGTNAFGLALIELVPIEVEGDEHFLQKFQDLYNAAAPVFSSETQLIGGVGVFGLLENKPSHSLALATTAARAISEGIKVSEIIQDNALQREHLDRILATNPDGVLVLDGDGRIEFVNQAGERLLGIERSSLVGQLLPGVIQLPLELEEEMAKAVEFHGLETTLTIKSRSVNCEMSYVPFSDGHGAVLYLVEKEYIQKLAIRELSSKGDFGLKDIVGDSPQLRKVKQQVKSAAQAKASTLIAGELGTGKSLTAQVIHALSDFRDGPLIVFNCAAVPHEMITSELFGTLDYSTQHSKRHTSKFELAHGGMLYFQDINLLPLEGQDILLRFLKTGMVQSPGSNQRSDVQVRILAATCVSLQDLVNESRFNAELFSWLSVFQINLPALRDRKEDIPLLVNHILNRFSCRYRSSLDLAPESLEILCSYDWPGNIRELELIMERAVYCLGEECVIKPAHLPLYMTQLPGAIQTEYQPDRPQPLTELQEEALLQAARECNGNLSEIARVLGIGRTTVWRWFKRMNISPDNFRANGPGA